MKILFLTQILPYPPDSGPKVKTWNVLRHLCARGHEVTLVTYIRKEEMEHLSTVKRTVKAVIEVPIARSRFLDLMAAAQSAATGMPFLVVRDNQPGMCRTIARLALDGQYDVIHADQLTMAQFALQYREAALKANQEGGAHHDGKPIHHPQLVFDSHNATWLVLERSRSFSPAWLKPWLSLEARAMRRYEGKLVKAFDLTMAVSAEDAEALHKAGRMNSGGSGGREIACIPIAVDCEALQPVNRQAGFQITTMGTLYYPPNADGIRWFAMEVFPLVLKEAPGTTFTIVGRRPPTDFLELAKAHPGVIQVAGYLPDLTPCLENTAVMVIPVRSGGGMRVRILEAFARGIPVVTTTLGAEGIHAEPGRDLLIGDTPGDFAQAVIAVLKDPGLQESLAANGRRLAEQEYDWKVVLPRMDDVYPSPGKSLE